MFGYVKVYKPELKIREYEEYKGVYCTLCRTLGKEYGQSARMLLSFDATFYVLLLTMVSKNRPCPFTVGRCPFNPAKKCHYQDGNETLYRAAAALTIILSYHKVLDDIADARHSKRLAAKCLLPWIRRKYKKACKHYPDFARIAEECMAHQTEMEKSNTPSTDLAADASAKALELLFSLQMPEGTQKQVLSRTAYCIGRFVYLIDAYDDLKSDLKTGSYNPFIQKYKLRPDADLSDEALQRELVQTLHLTANEAALSFNLLDGQTHRSILQNIFYDGLENQISTVQKSYEKVKQHEESL